MRYRNISIIVSALFTLSLFVSAAYAADFIEPSKNEKCPVCGMFIYKFPKWTAEIIFRDGTYAAFDGPKDMFKYYFNLSKYSKDKRRADIEDIYVTEYYSTGRLSAKEMFFITGSDIYGPMGGEIIPVRGREAAETFMNDHKGQKMLAFDQVTPADIPGMMKMHKDGKHH